MPTKKDDVAYTDNYRGLSNDNFYRLENGNLVLPVAGGDEEPVVVQVHKPYGIRSQSWRSTAVGRPPVYPNPNSDLKLLGSEVVFPLPMPGGPGVNTFEYTLAGQYDYLITAATATAKFGTATGNPYPFSLDAIDSLQTPGEGAIDPDAESIDFSHPFTWAYPSYIGAAFGDSTLS